MFKTSEPNPKRPDSDTNQTSASETQFKTLDEFSNWLDEQLLILEDKHDGFQTCKSVRKFFSRS